MTNTNAFSAGAQEGNWWASYVASTPEREAKKRAMEAEQQRMISAHQEQQRGQAIMSQAGPAILELIEGYLNRNSPAVKSQVEHDFTQALPGATPGEFRTALEYLKQGGHVHELVSSTQGFMGERTSHLYTLGG
ncbi:hypothetical protein ACIPSE_36945 [Streptomyces sp. NPDC090106]|uniref:hypothetical protein n=1 Tax=Streptomyces sp. NPDC090106 TaxID=3365946 RepID=UPI00382681C1